MKVQVVERSLPTGAETAKPYMQEIEQALTRSLQYTRTLMAEFSPPDFDKLGLPAALMWLKERMKQHTPGHHFGLRSIEERVEKMGGRFKIVTEAGQGCTVTLELPLEETRESQQWLAAGAARPDRVGRNENYHPDQNTLPLF